MDVPTDPVAAIDWLLDPTAADDRVLWHTRAVIMQARAALTRAAPKAEPVAWDVWKQEPWQYNEAHVCKESVSDLELAEARDDLTRVYYHPALGETERQIVEEAADALADVIAHRRYAAPPARDAEDAAGVCARVYWATTDNPEGLTLQDIQDLTRPYADAWDAARQEPKP